MQFIITWQMKPGRLHEALDLFAGIPAEVLAQEPGPTITTTQAGEGP